MLKKIVTCFLKEKKNNKNLICILKTLIIALIGGSIFFYLNTPLPWMLGALTSVLLGNLLLKQCIYWPPQLCYTGMLLVGYNIGRTFTRETGKEILIQLPLMLMATILTVLFSLLQGYITYKKTGISLDSGLTGSTPGGLSQMVVLCEEIPNADVTVVTFMQTARQLAVVFFIPFLAVHAFASKTNTTSVATMVSEVSKQQHLSLGYLMLLGILVIASGFISRFFKIPTPFFMGPLLIISLLVLCGFTAPKPPKVYINIAQVFIGAYMGNRIDLSKLKNWRKLLPHTILNVIGLLIFSLILAYILMYFYHVPIVTAFLSTAPGGMAEMGLTAMTVHADVSTVVAFQLFRLLFVLLIVPPLIKKVLHHTYIKNN